MRENLSDFYLMDYLKTNKCVYCERKVGWFSKLFNLEIIDKLELLFTYSSKHWIFYRISEAVVGKVNKAYALKLFVCPKCSKLNVVEKKQLFKKSYAIFGFHNLDYCDKCVSTNVKRIPDIDKDGYMRRSATYVCQDCGNSWGRVN